MILMVSGRTVSTLAWQGIDCFAAADFQLTISSVYALPLLSSFLDVSGQLLLVGAFAVAKKVAGKVVGVEVGEEGGVEGLR